MIIRDIEQGSSEWLQLRVSCVTSSQLWRIMPGKRGYLKERENYMAELACEKITGLPYEHFVTADMERGSDLEFLARSAYEAKTGIMVEEICIAEHDSIQNFKGSPDGLITDGIIEIKMPKTANHFKTITTGNIDMKYIYQMQGNMMCCNAKVAEFISFDDRVPEHLQLFIARVDYDPQMALNIDSEIEKFTAELTAMIGKLNEKCSD